MRSSPSVPELWRSIQVAPGPSMGERQDSLPDPVRRYLRRAIAPGTPPAAAVRLRMHGQIRLRRWWPFRAEQVISPARGMIWQASVRMGCLPVRGFDRLLDGEGAMRWKLLGLVPLVHASGPDITRSAAGRMAAELIWLPPALGDPRVSWTALGSDRIEASLQVQG